MNLPKNKILRRQEDFLAVRQNGLRLECGPFVFNAAKIGPDDRPPRLGVVTSKRAVGDAVRRNRGRRLYKEIFRTHPGCLPNGWDAVVIVRGDPDRAPFEKLVSKFLRACDDAVAGRVRPKPERRPPGGKPGDKPRAPEAKGSPVAPSASTPTSDGAPAPGSE